MPAASCIAIRLMSTFRRSTRDPPKVQQSCLPLQLFPVYLNYPLCGSYCCINYPEFMFLQSSSQHSPQTSEKKTAAPLDMVAWTVQTPHITFPLRLFIFLTANHQQLRPWGGILRFVLRTLLLPFK